MPESASSDFVPARLSLGENVKIKNVFMVGNATSVDGRGANRGDGDLCTFPTHKRC